MAQDRLLDRHLDRVERMLQKCIEADRKRRREIRKNPDFLIQEAIENLKKREEQKRKRSGRRDEQP